MKAFINHFQFEFKSGLRDKTLLLMNYLFPLVFYFMMGFFMSSINPMFHEVIVPSMIFFAILVSTLLGMPNPLVGARDSGIYRSYKINGVPKVSVLGIPAISTIVHMIIIAIIIIITAPLFFGGILPANMGYFILIFISMLIACTGLGLLIGVLSPNARVTVLWAQIIFIPSMIIGGIMLPSNMLPESVARVGKLLPSTYAMNAFNGLCQGQKGLNPAGSILILLAGGIIAALLSLYLFRWDSTNASKRKNPLLAVLVLIPYVVGMLLL